MLNTITTLGAIAAFAATVSAHGSVTGVTIDGNYIRGYRIQDYYAMQQGGKVPDHIGWYAENLDNGFVAPSAFGTADIICHKAASTKGSSDSMAKVAAGGKFDVHWDTWPESHVGPVITYVAPYTGDIGSVDKASLEWVKIQEDGYENGSWAAVDLIKNNFTGTVNVPSSLAAGKYVFRHEIIALHAAGSVDGAQNYPFCLNIEVTGSGTSKPSGGVVGTKLYTENEDGIVFNVYTSSIKYNIPGPKLWSGASAGGSPSTPSYPSTPTNATPSSAPSSTPAPAASSAPSPSPASSAQPAASSPSTGGSSGSLPESFTIETFISWLEAKAAGGKARRHARSFF